MSGGTPLLGSVLAGGEGRRYGREKGGVVLGGVSLVERAAGTLQQVFDTVALIGHPRADLPWPSVPDRRVGRGPLAGIETALVEASARGLDGVFVLACDLPLVSVDTVRRLVAALGDASAVAPARRGAPAVEPLCAAYRVACLEPLRALLDRGQGAAHRLLDEVGGVVLEVGTDEFLNVNTIEDGRRASEALDRIR